MLSLPKELIIHISTFTERIDVRYDNPNCNYDYDFYYEYPMWNLYATCKTFQWMLLSTECLRLCADESIVTTNINGVYHGKHYDMMFDDIDYYVNGDIVDSKKCDKKVMSEYPIVKLLIDKNNCDYIYINKIIG